MLFILFTLLLFMLFMLCCVVLCWYLNEVFFVVGDDGLPIVEIQCQIYFLHRPNKSRIIGCVRRCVRGVY